jgi:hypothetical protein
MSALETFLKRYPDGENYAPHCFEFYETGYLDGEVFQFQITKSLEQQIQGHVLKLREELATLRPAAEALKTAVELKMGILILSAIVSVDYPDDEVSEVLEGDPLAATIKAINRAAEAVKENGK